MTAASAVPLDVVEHRGRYRVIGRLVTAVSSGTAVITAVYSSVTGNDAITVP